MHRPARALTSLALALMLAACQLPGGAGPAGKPSPKAGGVGPRGGQLLGPAGASLVGMDGATLIGLDAASLIGADGASLVGPDGASLVGPDGASLNGPGGAGLVGPDGASLVGPDGASLIGADGASIAGTVRAPAGMVAAGAGNMVAAGAGNAVSDMGGLYRLQAVAEKPLANVHVYLRTASGKFVVDRKTGKPISAITNAKGEFAFKNWRAARGLTVFVPTGKVAGEVQGLAGLRPKDQGEAQPIAVDLASTFMASWIYERVLAAQPDRAASLDRLPAALGAEAYGRVAAAVRADLVPTAGKLARNGLADALERLRGEDAALGAKLEEVRRVMTLAGTDSTQAAGARAITLQQPVDVAQGPDGALYVAEAFGGVVRRIGTDGRAEVVVGQGSRNEAQIGALFASDIAIGPKDGKLYLNSKYTAAIFRCNPDGSGFETFAGGGRTPVGPGVRATDAQIEPARALAFDQEGGLIIAESDRNEERSASRLLRVAPDGTIGVLEAPWTGEPPLSNAWREIAAFNVAPDGAQWCLEFQAGELWLREPGGAWRAVARGLTASHDADLLPQADGAVLLSMGRRFNEGEQVIDRFTRQGARTRFAGSGTLGADSVDVAKEAAEFADPAGLAAGAGGAVLVADRLAGMVRAIGPDGIVRVVAGRTTGPDVEALSEPLNVPGSIAIDARGRVIVAEFAGHSIRRIEGDRSVRIAGGEPGVAPDGARADKLYAPTGLAFQGEDMIVVEQGQRQVRRIRPDGTITTIAGGGWEEVGPERYASPPRARDIMLREPLAVAVSPDGQIYFNDRERVWKILPDGGLALIAGWVAQALPTTPTDRAGRPAREVPVGRSSGLAFDQAGNLYVAEVNNSQIVKIDPAGILTVFAGAGSEATFVKLLGGEIEREGEVAAADAALVVPSGLAFDRAGNLYVTEMGTRGVQSLASTFLGGATAVPLVDGRIRKIDPSGRVTTVAGLGGPPGTALRNPVGVVVDLEGHVVFVDNGTNQLKRL